MPKTILDLTDEIIQQIGSHLHQDNTIPLPSFHPHILNFASSITPDAHKDYVSFRATPRIIRSVCEPKGSHLVVKKWETLLYFAVETPQNVLSGIRRVELDVASRNLSIAYAWPVFTNFLNMLPNLEELVIKQSPLCHHNSNRINSSQLRLPPNDYLSSLKSLAFAMKCIKCHESLPQLIFPAVSNLHHLKVTSFSGCKTAMKEWQDRHPTQIPELKTLFYKSVPFLQSMVSSRLESIPGLFPGLAKLAFACDESDSSDSSGGIMPSLQLRAEGIGLDSQGWKIMAEYDRDFLQGFLLFTQYFDVTEADSEEDLSHFCRIFNQQQSLRTLDAMIAFTIFDRRPKSPVYNPTFNMNTCPRQVEDEISTYESKLRSAMCAGAECLIQRIPHLRGGYFYEPYIFNKDWDRPVEFWYRWEWYKDMEEVKVYPRPQFFNADFTLNEDGTQA